MSYIQILNFSLDTVLFSFTSIFLSFLVGWLFYNFIVTRNIPLKDQLFSKDNLAAWIEFIGAFIFPTLYLAAKAIEGPASSNIWADLLICNIYALGYILILTVLRLLSGVVVASSALNDEDGKISLNNEIYNQKNIAASIFSVTLSMIFVSIIKFLDFSPENFYISFLKFLFALVVTLVAFIGFSLLVKRKTGLLKEIFVDNNHAAAASLLGYIFAAEIVINKIITLKPDFDYVFFLIYSAVSLIILGLLSVCLKVLICKMLSVDFWSEIYEQNNFGAAIGQCALYVGVAEVIVHFIS